MAGEALGIREDLKNLFWEEVWPGTLGIHWRDWGEFLKELEGPVCYMKYYREINPIFISRDRLRKDVLMCYVGNVG